MPSAAARGPGAEANFTKCAKLIEGGGGGCLKIVLYGITSRYLMLTFTFMNPSIKIIPHDI